MRAIPDGDGHLREEPIMQMMKPWGTSGLGSTGLLVMVARRSECSSAVAGERGLVEAGRGEVNEGFS
jgi:hypothetical protein